MGVRKGIGLQPPISNAAKALDAAPVALAAAVDYGAGGMAAGYKEIPSPLMHTGVFHVAFWRAHFVLESTICT